MITSLYVIRYRLSSSELLCFSEDMTSHVLRKEGNQFPWKIWSDYVGKLKLVWVIETWSFKLGVCRLYTSTRHSKQDQCLCYSSSHRISLHQVFNISVDGDSSEPLGPSSRVLPPSLWFFFPDIQSEFLQLLAIVHLLPSPSRVWLLLLHNPSLNSWKQSSVLLVFLSLGWINPFFSVSL